MKYVYSKERLHKPSIENPIACPAYLPQYIDERKQLVAQFQACMESVLVNGAADFLRRNEKSARFSKITFDEKVRIWRMVSSCTVGRAFVYSIITCVDSAWHATRSGLATAVVSLANTLVTSIRQQAQAYWIPSAFQLLQIIQYAISYGIAEK